MTALSQCRVTVPATKMFAEASEESAIETELLFGEQATILANTGQFYHVQSAVYASPCYVKKIDVHAIDLHRRSVNPSHRVVVPCAVLYADPNFKRPCELDWTLTTNALVRLHEWTKTPEGDMVRAEGAGWLFKDQVWRIDAHRTDYVELMLQYVGAYGAYRWGGRVLPDCSGLVQQALMACNISCARNVGEQEQSLGMQVDAELEEIQFKRGDFVFWTGIPGKSRHVVTMIDDKMCVHASIARPRHVVVELLREVIDKQWRDGNGKPTSVRRFPNRKFS